MPPAPTPPPPAPVSGPRVSGAPVSGARVSAAPVPGAAAASIQAPVTKEYVVKKALGLAGSTVAPSVPPGCKSIFSVVSSNPDFTFLTAALKATGLDSILSDPALVATVFAPTDAAFTKALIALGLRPQQLLNDVATLTVILKYHVIPGLTLAKANLVDGQFYDTLLTDSHHNIYQLEYVWTKTIDLVNLKLNGDLAAATSYTYKVVPSGGAAAKITAFDINAGCPTIAHVIDTVLIPAYKDAVALGAADLALNIFTSYQAVNATLPYPPYRKP